LNKKNNKLSNNDYYPNNSDTENEIEQSRNLNDQEELEQDNSSELKNELIAKNPYSKQIKRKFIKKN